MQRADIMEGLKALRLHGIAAAFDEVIDEGVKRSRTPLEVVGRLLQAETAERAEAEARLRAYVDRLLALPPDSLSDADRRFLAERDAALASGTSPTGSARVAWSVGTVFVFGATVVVVGVALLILVDGIDL